MNEEMDFLSRESNWFELNSRVHSLDFESMWNIKLIL